MIVAMPRINVTSIADFGVPVDLTASKEEEPSSLELSTADGEY